MSIGNKKDIVKWLVACFTFAISTVSSFAQDNMVLTTDEDKPAVEESRHDTSKLRYPIKSTEIGDYENLNKRSAIDVKEGADYTSEVEYDPNTGLYIFYRKIGNLEVATPFALNATEYTDYMLEQSMSNYWLEKNAENADKRDKLSLSNIEVGLGTAGDKIFGPGGVKIKTQGTVELKLGMSFLRRENPSISERNRKSKNFDFDAKIQISANGTVGDRIKFNLNYNTESTFDADKELVKLGYEGKEDDIIKKIEVGHVSLPLSSTLIPGSTSLFGIMTQLQYGKLKVSAVVSKQESESKTISTKNGSQTTEYMISALDYDENRHFFIDEFFYHNYDKWMTTAPNINSGVVIKKIEVWVTNKNKNSNSLNTTTRNILAFKDLAQSKNPLSGTYFNDEKSFPTNKNGNMYSALTSKSNEFLREPSSVDNVIEKLVEGNFEYPLENGSDYEAIVNARMLSASEYTLNEELGYISLRASVDDDEALAVAYEYTYNGQTFKVGELTTDNINKKIATDSTSARSSSLFVKLIKATSNNPSNEHLWKLMMKNVYNIGGYNIQEDKFKLDIRYNYHGDSTSYYRTDLPAETGLENKPLIQTLGMDRLNSRHRAAKDGKFDFLEGLTVLAAQGRVILPLVEPFGSGLERRILNKEIAKKYTFPELYSLTKTGAEEFAEKNKFYLNGEYKSTSGSEIRLNATQIPRGSVRVTAGGRQLQENVGYTVDYSMGIVRILDESVLASNQQVNVTLESKSMFSTQQKSLVGTNLEYAFNDHFSLGATIMHLSEKPLTDKVANGYEPISNTIWGLNGSFSTQSNWLTKITNAIPGINATAPSQFTLSGEFAQLSPGHGSGIEDKTGESASYIDDFEGSESKISLMAATSWTLASVPTRKYMTLQTQLGGLNLIRPRDAFWDPIDSLGSIRSGLQRAHFAWYHIDNIFQKKNENTLKSISADEKSNHFVREIKETEIFQHRDLAWGETTTLNTFNLAYYPRERGMYNLDVTQIDPETGLLLRPENRWGGIMRRLDQTDFEKSNIEYLQFWLMDPWAEADSLGINKNSYGKLVFNLGEISEDILKDGRLQHEDGLPTSNNQLVCDDLIWGRTPRKTNYSAFDNSELANQDYGLNGLNDKQEKTYMASFGRFYQYMDSLAKANNIKSEYMNRVLSDPAGDDFHHYRGDDWDSERMGVLGRYKFYNGMEGNSTADNNSKYSSTSSTYPNTEDLNGDNNVNTKEMYYEYVVNISREMFEDSTLWADNFIVSCAKSVQNTANRDRRPIKWYQFRIPIRDANRYFKQGEISGFNSIRFIRMYMTGFKEETFLRFGALELTKTNWKVYKRDAKLFPEEGSTTNIDAIQISVVDKEKDTNKKPVGYCMPPNIKVTYDPSQPQAREENEKSMLLAVSNLEPKAAAGVYKTTSFDARQYERLKMYVHAENIINPVYEVPDNRLHLFVRLGNDFTENYYEYQVPLKFTQPNAILDTEVWPKENEIDFAFEDFTNLKLRRNKDRLRGGKVSNVDRYSEMDGFNIMTVVGNPTFADVTSMMIGVKNEDDQTVTAEIWVDEMRMTGFNEDGGWAAMAKMGFTLSDFASFDATGRIETTGFGGLEANVMDRNMEDTYTLDMSTTLQLGKFFPEKARVNMPLSISYSREKEKPKYDPTDTDVLLDDALDLYNDKDIKSNADSIRKEVEAQSLTINEFTSYALTNVRVGIVSKKKPMPYDPANFSFSLGYNKRTEKDPETVYDKTQNYNGDFNYSYSLSPKPVEPFKKVKFLKNNNWKLIRDFNFYYLPTNLSFSTSMKRYYNEVLLRDFSSTVVRDTSFSCMSWDKDWTWDRSADIKWNLTKALKVNFSTSMNSTIDEIFRAGTDADGNYIYRDAPVNRGYLNDAQKWAEASLEEAERKYLFDNNEDELWYERWKDTVKSSLRHFGSPYIYNQRLNASYNIPINKIPYLDWITANAQYSADYNWQRGVTLDLNESNSADLNIAMSKRNWSGDTRMNLETLYNKSDYLKNINKKFNSRKPNSTKKKKEEEKEKKEEDNKPKTYERKNIRLKQGNKTRISHRLGATKVIVTATDKDGNPYTVKHEVIDANAINLIPSADATNINVVITAKKVKENKVVDCMARVLMMVRNVSANYRYTDALTINGYNKGSGFFGMDQARNPGADFTFGFFNREDFRTSVIDRGLVHRISDGMSATPIQETTNLDIQLRSQVEPFPGIKIDLNGAYSHSDNMNTFYYSNSSGMNSDLSEFRGNMSHTTIALRTAFKGAEVNSHLFDEFMNNIHIMQGNVVNEIRERNESDMYGSEDVPYTTSDVLVPAFMAAYRGKSLNETHSPLPDTRSMDRNGKTIKRSNPRPAFWNMLPNWKLTFDLLNKATGLKETFKTFNITHGYRCTFNINNYEAFSDWGPLADNKYGIVNNSDNDAPHYLSTRYAVSSVNYNEQFNPLIGVNASLKNSVRMKVEYKKNRTASLDVPALQVVESYGKELVIGSGYRIDDFGAILGIGGDGKKQKKVSNDLNLGLDISFKNTDAFIRKIEENLSELNSGIKNFSLSFTAEYVVSNSFNIQFYFDRSASHPKISSSYPIINTDFGFKLKFQLNN